jgi:hypothetical protein
MCRNNLIRRHIAQADEFYFAWDFLHKPLAFGCREGYD